MRVLFDFDRACSTGPVALSRKIRIGRPGYRVTKLRHPDTGQRSLMFEIEYPEIDEDLQPRHRCDKCKRMPRGTVNERERGCLLHLTCACAA